MTKEGIIGISIKLLQEQMDINLNDTFSKQGPQVVYPVMKKEIPCMNI